MEDGLTGSGVWRERRAVDPVRLVERAMLERDEANCMKGDRTRFDPGGPGGGGGICMAIGVSQGRRVPCPSRYPTI